MGSFLHRFKVVDPPTFSGIELDLAMTIVIIKP
jgi:hypothetical protein